jgi:hypothetical protein
VGTWELGTSCFVHIIFRAIRNRAVRFFVRACPLVHTSFFARLHRISHRLSWARLLQQNSNKNLTRPLVCMLMTLGWIAPQLGQSEVASAAHDLLSTLCSSALLLFCSSAHLSRFALLARLHRIFPITTTQPEKRITTTSPCALTSRQSPTSRAACLRRCSRSCPLWGSNATPLSKRTP